MDCKQKHILKGILEKNHLGNPDSFIQHRNLKEFRCFFIERINPNHRIFLYGKLRKPVDRNYGKIIKVGELLFSMSFVFFVNDVLFNFAVNCIAIMFILDFWYWRFIDVNWHRGKCRHRENVVSCALST